MAFYNVKPPVMQGKFLASLSPGRKGLIQIKGSGRGKHHDHLPAFHFWHGFDLGQLFHFLTHPVQYLGTQFLMGHFPPAKPQGNLHLVASVDEFADIAHLHLIIMFVDIGAEFDFLDVNDLLPLFGFIGALLGLILEFTVIKDLAYRRVNIRLDLYQIKANEISTSHRFVNRDDTQLFAVFIYATYLGGSDGTVNTGT